MRSSSRWKRLATACAARAAANLAALSMLAAACGNDPQPAGSTTPPPSPTAPRGDIPCAAANVLTQRCAKCHGVPLRMSAPNALVTASDFQVARGTSTVAANAHVRVNDPVRRMPPPPDAALAANELADLDSWLAAGAAPDPNGCAVISPMLPPPAPAGGAGGAGGSGGSTVAATGGAGAAGSAGAGSGGSAGSAQAGSGGATAPSRAWGMFGRDLENSRSNPDETVLSAESVPRLRELWHHNGASTTSTPAVADGVLYLPSWDGAVHALRADDGSIVWKATLPDLIDSSPSVSDSAVYVADDAGSVHALSRDKGVKLWSKRVEPHPEAHLWSSPLFLADANLVVVGVASGEEVMGVPEPRTFRGSVVALDAQSGEIKWQLYTTPDDDTSGPGIAVWSTAAVDTARKVLYIGTGNNYEAPTGKYADSLLAIDYQTGKLVWATQFTSDDVFVVGFGATGPDFDIGSSPNLFKANDKDMVGIGVKNGIYYALDRETGVIKWMTMVTPGSPLGGVISASAYANGTLYVASNRFMEGMTRTVALDANNGAVKWEHVEPSVTYGGVAHANGVAYVATNGGTIWALDAQSGRELWSEMLPDAIGGSPVVADGMLFVPWGYQWTLRGGMPGAGGLTAYGL